MKALIEQRLEGITEQAEQVKAHMPEIIQWQKDRIVEKFNDAGIEPESGRVEQELVLLAQKMDVDEEIDRLFSHVSETQQDLEKRWPTRPTLRLYDARV